MSRGGENSQRVLVLAPVGRDAELLVHTAVARGLIAQAFPSVEGFCAAFAGGCGAAVLTEEALYADRGGRLRAAVAEQPAWSEVPFVVLASRGQADERVQLTLDLMQPLRNATVIERPVRPGTIATALEAALRDRRRQYEVRDAIEALRLANLDLERRVEERTADLVAKVGELEGFCYSVSHDMRTPLRAIVSNAVVVLEEEGPSVSEEGRDRLERLSAAAIKMAHLIDDLLQYARLGNTEPKRRPCDLSELARQVADEALFDRNRSTADVTVAPGMVGLCDSRLVGLVLHNLVDNALKYGPASGPGRVEIGQDESGAIFVRNEGIGFDMRYAGKIFKPFERLHRDGEYSGTGIGLANVQRIVERHGGRVWAEGEPGKGATFWFTLGA